MKKLHNHINDILFEMISAIVITFVVISILFVFVFRIITVSGESMLPSYSDGDRLIVTLQSDYEYSDVVVIVQPGILNEPIVKRVVATGGQWVDVDYESGIVYVGNSSDNMLPLEEDYILTPATVRNFDDTNEYPVQIPDGKIFVMGDNRNNSTDSRSYMVGLIDEDYVLGEVVCKMWSVEHGFEFLG